MSSNEANANKADPVRTVLYSTPMNVGNNSLVETDSDWVFCRHSGDRCLR